MKHLLILTLLLTLLVSGCKPTHESGSDVALLPDNSAQSGELSEPKHPLRLTKFSFFYLQSQYYDVKRLDWQKMASHGIDTLQKQIPEMIARFDKPLSESPTTVKVSISEQMETFTLSDIEGLVDAYVLLTAVFNHVLTYVDEKHDPSELEYAMLNGMFATLDPHTNVLTPRYFEEMMSNQRGFAGLGFVVGVRQNGLTVISPIEGAPAHRGGIRMGDHILHIDGESTENMPVEDAVDRMRGKAGTPVTLNITRVDWEEPREFLLVRENIKVSSVSSKALAKENVGYIKIKSFDQNTTRELKQKLNALHKALPDMDGLILDLRGNMGGLLVQSIEITELFLPKNKTVVTIEGVAGTQRDSSRSRTEGKEQGYPIALLIDKSSASASEIVAGALQYHNRALVIGETSFGKGTVQTLKENDDKSALKVTTAQYLTPGNVSIQGVGITPDIALMPTHVDEKDSIQLAQTRKSWREKDLGQSIISEKTKVRESKHLLHYLYQESKEEKEKAEKLGLLVYDLRSTADYYEDFQTLFAIGLLKSSAALKGTDMLEKAQSYLQETEDTFQKSLEKALNKHDIPWEAGNIALETCDHVSWEISLNNEKHDKNKPLLLKAGEKSTLTLEVTNHCETQSIPRLHAITDSNSPHLDEREFLFGWLSPGSTRSFSLEVDVPKSADTRIDYIRFDLLSDQKEISKGHSFLAQVEAIDKPVLSFNYWIDDVETGNADGALQKGEAVKVWVLVKNHGDMPTGKINAKVSNLSGRNLYLEKGKDSSGPIDAHGSQLFMFKIAISEELIEDKNLKSRRKTIKHRENEVKLKLHLSEDAYKVAINQDLSFFIDTEPPYTIKAEEATVSLKKGTMLRAAPETEKLALGELKEDASLPSPTVTSTGWRRIHWVEEEQTLYGWVAPDNWEITEEKTSDLQLQRCCTLVAPHIEFQTKGPILTQESTVELKATLTDDKGLKDYQVYVWSQDGQDYQMEKVDYAVLSGKESHINFTVPVRKGDNNVLILARDGEDQEQTASFHITRFDEKSP